MSKINAVFLTKGFDDGEDGFFQTAPRQVVFFVQPTVLDEPPQNFDGISMRALGWQKNR